VDECLVGRCVQLLLSDGLWAAQKGRKGKGGGGSRTVRPAHCAEKRYRL
jgi:hypothetical protein